MLYSYLKKEFFTKKYNKCGKHKQIYTPKQGVASAAPISTKFAIKQILVDIIFQI